MTSNYEVRVADVCGISFSDMRTVDLYRGEIVRISTGKIAYKTKDYYEPRTARLQASRLLKNYEHHLAKHGVGFEEQEAQRKADERAARETKRNAERLLRDAARDLLAALQGLLAVPAASGTSPDRNTKREAAVKAAQAAIAKATGSAN